MGKAPNFSQSVPGCEIPCLSKSLGEKKKKIQRVSGGLVPGGGKEAARSRPGECTQEPAFNQGAYSLPWQQPKEEANSQTRGRASHHVHMAIPSYHGSQGVRQSQSTRVQRIFPQNPIDRGRASGRIAPHPSHPSWPWLRASDVQV